MKRNKQHQIDADARKIFEAVVPSLHVLRPQPMEDYGIDYEIELFENDESTGFIFKTQLKGTENIKYKNDGKQISLSGFEIENATYLIEEIEIPSTVILVDTIKKDIFWISVQTNQALLDNYKKSRNSNQKSLTLTFDVKNILPNTWKSLVDEMVKSAYIVALKKVPHVPTSIYSDYLNNINNLDHELVHLHKKIDLSLYSKLVRLIKANDILQSKNMISDILSNKDRSVELKFNAILLTEQIYSREHQSDVDAHHKAQFDLNRADKLLKLCEENNANEYLYHIANGYSLAAKFQYIILTDLQLYINKIVHEDNNSSDLILRELWLHDIEFNKIKIAKILSDILPEVFKYLSELLIQKHWEFFPDFSTKINWSLLILLIRLKNENMVEQAQVIEDWICNIINITLILSHHLSSSEQAEVIQERIFSQCIRLIDNPNNNDENISRYKSITEVVITGLSNEQVRNTYRKKLNKTLSEGKKQFTKSYKDNWEAIEKHYRQQAQVILGVDFSLLNNQITKDDERYMDAQLAWLIDIGIRDINPTRILKNCKYLIYRYWEHGGIALPAQRIGLHSARMKRMGCIKHPEHSTPVAHSLDELYSQFGDKFCKACVDCKSHSSDWEYSGEWHEQQIDKWDLSVQKYRSKPKSN